jgi:hypothetical protein
MLFNVQYPMSNVQFPSIVQGTAHSAKRHLSTATTWTLDIPCWTLDIEDRTTLMLTFALVARSNK